jgi:hypothetical protein
MMLLGMPEWYMISEMNSNALVAVMEAADFALIHLVNLSTATKMCVNPLLAFLNGPTKLSPHNEEGYVTSMVYK